MDPDEPRSNLDLDLIKRIFKDKPLRYLVMLTNVAFPDVIKQLVREGVRGLINKPLTSNKIVSEIEKFLLLEDFPRTRENLSVARVKRF